MLRHEGDPTMTTILTEHRVDAAHRSDTVRSWVRAGVPGRLAIVDRELDPDDSLVAALRTCGIDTAVDGDDLAALVHLATTPPDVVLVAATTPGDAGRFVSVVREQIGCPVLVAWEAGHEGQLREAVAAGAHPVVGQPYHLDEILGALRPLWPTSAPPAPAVRVGDLLLEPDGYECRVRGRTLDLTTIEFQTLALLAARADRVVSRQALIRALWPTVGDPDGAMAATVTRLRRKLAAAGAGPVISTLRGVGYRLESRTPRLSG
ncbi:winged helix-turn-helix transcriptional regulator [Cellulomonas sp. S1-8]|uniref:winged helix-turn-helix transcriptional regulator n=1 Tax=Cellulomonas sp. S1-8 TaxID=2904790 RepID=UPI00224345AE|nr:response regulator transcription factor [Cellulomonas sp. S1-8]UZN02025.1 response regulator transcription factor [Cellulomonas sp. S1-8]